MRINLIEGENHDVADNHHTQHGCDHARNDGSSHDALDQCTNTLTVTSLLAPVFCAIVSVYH